MGARGCKTTGLSLQPRLLALWKVSGLHGSLELKESASDLVHFQTEGAMAVIHGNFSDRACLSPAEPGPAAVCWFKPGHPRLGLSPSQLHSQPPTFSGPGPSSHRPPWWQGSASEFFRYSKSRTQESRSPVPQTLLC